MVTYNEPEVLYWLRFLLSRIHILSESAASSLSSDPLPNQQTYFTSGQKAHYELEKHRGLLSGHVQAGNSKEETPKLAGPLGATF